MLLRTLVLCLLIASGCARPSPVSAPASGLGARPVSTGTLRRDSLWSAALGVRKQVVVYLPPSYAQSTSRRYPSVYYLHGMWGSERDWSTQGRIAQVADSLITGGMPEVIIVMPDGDNGYYTNWATPGDVAACRREPPVPEPADTYCVPTPRYETYMAQDLVRWVDTTFRTIPRGRHRGIAGLSMGGYGAITLALRRPETWSAAASHSGVLSLIQSRDSSGVAHAATDGTELERRWGPRFWPLIAPVFGRDTAQWWAREPSRLARRHASSVIELALYIDVGSSDALVVGGNRIFREEVVRLGLPVEYHEWPGAHTWSYWRARLPEGLQWLARRVAAD